MIDITALRNIQKRQGRLPRILDVACGTGLLLKQLLSQVPEMEMYGLDASADMLAVAQSALQHEPYVQLEQIKIGYGTILNLPFKYENFDLITCTNALHDIPEAVTLLAELGKLLTPGGKVVLEDFAPRQPRLVWATFEWFLQLVEGNKVRAYTLKEAKLLCEQAGLHIDHEKVFTIDWLWHGWTIKGYRTTTETITATL